jgi:hypothetical protein
MILLITPEIKRLRAGEQVRAKRRRARRRGQATGRGDRARAVIAAHDLVVPHPDDTQRGTVLSTV